MTFRKITNALFDTSFLLNDSSDIEGIIKILRKDGISCYISSTVQSELEYLYYTGRISQQKFNRGIARYKRARAKNIETIRNYYQESVTMACTLSMTEVHGVEPKDVRNDCNILTSSLNNHIDMILSEDFHFTSKHSDKVVDTVCSKTCDRFHKLCECDILLLNKDTFLKAYKGNQIDEDIVEARKKDVRKDSKLLNRV